VSPSKSQARRAASRARYEAYLERRARKQHRRVLVQRGLLVAAGVVVVLLAGWWLLGSGSDSTPSATPTPSPSDGMSWDSPEQVLTPGKPATATIATNRGDVVIDLATDAAPQASNSLAFLAGQGYFDGTTCHRLTADPQTPLYVLQCGDPTGTGSGGPGYTIPDENLPKAGEGNYPAGTVAMAEPQNGQAGSQFFLVYRDSTLAPNYTVLGTVSEGMDVLRAIGKAGVDGGGTDGAPAKPVTVDTVTVDEG
jgi:peptidyl-prolyl cis-trans isomerase B (cyclophilin B)